MSNVVNFVLINELLCDYPRARIYNLINPLAVSNTFKQTNKSKKSITKEHNVFCLKISIANENPNRKSKNRSNNLRRVANTAL